MTRRCTCLALLFLLPPVLSACSGKVDDTAPNTEEADADTDTDTDTDADTDTDTDLPDEDCGDGVDNDGDGLTDCEDEDCLDVCGEDCGDGTDNDGDGLTDCEDDECVGDAACAPTTGTYDLSMVTTFTKFPGYNYALYLGWGPASWELSGQPAVLSAYGYTTIAGIHQEGGGAFSCTGDFYVAAYGDADPPGDKGARYVGGADGTVDYVFSVAPSAADGSLTWRSPCPVEVPPIGDWGFYAGKEYFAQRTEGGPWTRQYSAGVSSLFYYYTDFTSIGLLYLQSLTPITWTADYTF